MHTYVYVCISIWIFLHICTYTPYKQTSKIQTPKMHVYIPAKRSDQRALPQGRTPTSRDHTSGLDTTTWCSSFLVSFLVQVCWSHMPPVAGGGSCFESARQTRGWWSPRTQWLHSPMPWLTFQESRLRGAKALIRNSRKYVSRFVCALVSMQARVCVCVCVCVCSCVCQSRGCHTLAVTA